MGCPIRGLRRKKSDWELDEWCRRHHNGCMGWMIIVVRGGRWVFTGVTYSSKEVAASIGATMGEEVRYVPQDPRLGTPPEGTPVEHTGYLVPEK